MKAILADADLRRKLMVSTIQATQAREGIETSPAQADRAYYVVTEAERAAFFELERFKGGKKGEQDKRHEMFVRSLRDEAHHVRHDVARRDFAAIDGTPLNYQRLGLVAHLFRENAPLEPSVAEVRQGLSTADDSRFVRFRWEVPVCSVGIDSGWAPFAKGGDFSRFYQSFDLVVLWKDDGDAIKRFNEQLYGEGSWSRQVRSRDRYGLEGLTWPRRTQRGFNIRKMPPGHIFADKGPAVFAKTPADLDFILGLLSSECAEFILRGLMSFGSWEVGVVKRLPVPSCSKERRRAVAQAARAIHDLKAAWDSGNEVSGSFERPWVLGADGALAERLEDVSRRESEEEERIRTLANVLNEEVYSAYGVRGEVMRTMKDAVSERPPEFLWPQMEGKTTEQKRMEHVWRLLSYAVKRVIDADDDGIVPFNRSTGETPLAERVRAELAALFPGRDESQLEVEIVNELKRSVKGYRKCASLEDWLANAFFEYHASLYKSRPIYWHIASVQGTAPFAFGALVHYHRFDKNRMAKLRASYVRDTIEELRRDAGLADKAGRADDRVELQAKLEEVQALDKKLQLIQEGHHEGPEGGDRDFRILTPWKEPAARPHGWAPDLDDGVKVNIAPLDRAGVLRVSGAAG
ncbi:hypothetical protein QEG98_26215 [Myxococcus sp. MxC21-1]|uniref:hypothetical protein n=1 Tax=Myxococcus sp. MxC21-1 TaxID=3041439 RepID=UPI00292E5CB6|nr:hypothetical protein [Myxococcus sp. MxC21-1]WNZ59539.1 hypothetical protein QEG98_26215 [Myxococcus sp. MxC21-1]